MQHNLQYNQYQQRGIPPFSDSPSDTAPGLAANQAINAYGGGSPAGNLPMHEEQQIYALVIDLLNPGTREGALLELSKKREQYDDLALVLWHSFGA
jgi:CCR4-NOT transcription complex subunit 9